MGTVRVGPVGGVESRTDVVVIGSGPAALLLAAGCAARGASVTVVSPNPHGAWKPIYCVWEHQLPERFRRFRAVRWSSVSVHAASGAIELHEPYARLDNTALQRALLAELREFEATFVEDAVERVDHGSHGSAVICASGRQLRGRVVVDASGAATRLTRRTVNRPASYQTAYGALLHWPGHPWGTASAELMDWRPAPSGSERSPSFLYALPVSTDMVFLEETCLVGRPALGTSILRERLRQRSAGHGLPRWLPLAEEYCSVAMGLGLPQQGQRIVPFGAAAAMIHPATGYSIGRALSKVDAVADALTAGLWSGGGAAAASAANRTVWPRHERISWELYRLGIEVLLDLDQTELSRFFASFFSLPVEQLRGFFAGSLDAGGVFGAMLKLFARTSTDLRWRLVKGSLSSRATGPVERSFLEGGVT